LSILSLPSGVTGELIVIHGNISYNSVGFSIDRKARYLFKGTVEKDAESRTSSLTFPIDPENSNNRDLITNLNNSNDRDFITNLKKGNTLITVIEIDSKKIETKFSLKGSSQAIQKIFDNRREQPTENGRAQSLDILNSPLATLKSELKGKTKQEVKKIFGEPDRLMDIEGHRVWVYGTTHTSADRGIMFEGNEVLTVSFY
jgi:hypothetical protein